MVRDFTPTLVLDLVLTPARSSASCSRVEGGAGGGWKGSGERRGLQVREFTTLNDRMIVKYEGPAKKRMAEQQNVGRSEEAEQDRSCTAEYSVIFPFSTYFPSSL